MLHRSRTAFAAAGTAVLALAVTSLASEPRRDASPSGRTHGAMGIGPYHKLSLFDGTVAGQPRQAKIHTDYANVQITRWARP
jgi:hypothetical protein